MKKVSIILLLILLLFTLTSCEDINAILSLLPKFDTSLPNNISGKWAYYENEEYKAINQYSRLFTFDSKERKFTYEDTIGIKKNGSYNVEYKTYAISECNGTITLYYEDNSVISYEFYYKATATDGPDYLVLSNNGTYYYRGK